MKKTNLLILITLLFSYLTGIGQERITSIIGDGQGQRIVLQEHAGINYVLTITNNDVLTVFTEDSEILTELYSRSYTGISNQDSYETTKRHIIIENSSGLLAFNFTNNSEFFYPYPEGLTESDWVTRADKNESVYVRLNDDSFLNRQKMMVNLEDYTYDIFDEQSALLNITDSYIRDRIDPGEIESHFLVDRETGERTLMYEGTTLYAGDSGFNNFGFAYKANDEKAVMHFSTETMSEDTLMNLPEAFYRARVTAMDSFIVVFLQVDVQSDDAVDVYVFDSKQELIGEFVSDVTPYGLLPKLVANSIIGEDSRVFSIDIETGITKNYNFAIDNLIVVNENTITAPYNGGLSTVNLETGLQLGLLGLKTEGFIRGESTITLSDGTTLLNYDTTDDSNVSLYNLDFASLTVSDLLADQKNGLSSSAFLQSQSNAVTLSEKNIYTIIDDITEKTNVKPLMPLRFGNESIRYTDNEICWFENLQTQVSLNCVKDGIHEIYGELPNTEISFGNSNIIDYFKSGDKIYYSTNNPGNPKTLNYYNLTTDELVSSVPLTSNSFWLQGIGEDLFYSSNDTLFSINNGIVGEYFPIKKVPISGGIFNYKNNNYMVEDNTFYLLTPNTPVELLQGDLYRVQIYGDFLFLESGDQEFTIFDGSSFTEVTMETEFFFTSSLDYDNILVSEYNNDGTITPMIYNMNTNEFRSVPEPLMGKNIDGYFTINDENLLITSKQTSGVSSIIDIYQYDQQFESLVLKHSFESNGDYSNFDFIQLENGGLLYAGNSVIFIDSDSEFFPIENISGDYLNSKLSEAGDFIYFLAFDEELGRQVFRLNKNTISSSEDINKEISMVLFPNPSSDIISIKTEVNVTYYSIIDATGRVLKSKTITSSIENINIDISDLQTGTYLLTIITTEGTKTKTFTKI